MTDRNGELFQYKTHKVSGIFIFFIIFFNKTNRDKKIKWTSNKDDEVCKLFV